MKIYKETEIKHPLYIALLDNGATLFVYDGYAEDTEGRTYLPVTEEINEDEAEVIGWREKTDNPIS